MKLTQIAAICTIATTATLAQATPVWQDFSLTGLYGENYALPANGNDSKLVLCQTKLFCS